MAMKTIWSPAFSVLNHQQSLENALADAGFESYNVDG